MGILIAEVYKEEGKFGFSIDMTVGDIHLQGAVSSIGYISYKQAVEAIEQFAERMDIEPLHIYNRDDAYQSIKEELARERKAIELGDGT